MPQVKKGSQRLLFASYLKGARLEFVEGWSIVQSKAEGGLLDTLTLDLVVVPCVALDRFGYRLGSGYGYYDATLSQRSGNRPLTIYVGFKETVVSNCYRHNKDVRGDLWLGC